jgi:hypothetical protein
VIIIDKEGKGISAFIATLLLMVLAVLDARALSFQVKK